MEKKFIPQRKAILKVFPGVAVVIETPAGFVALTPKLAGELAEQMQSLDTTAAGIAPSNPVAGRGLVQ